MLALTPPSTSSGRRDVGPSAEMGAPRRGADLGWPNDMGSRGGPGRADREGRGILRSGGSLSSPGSLVRPAQQALPNGSWRIVLTPNEFLRQGQVTRAADAHLGTRDRFRLCLLPMVFAPDRLADWWLALAPLGHSGADELGRYVEDPETGSAFEAPARRVPDRLPAPRTAAAHTRRAALSHELLFAEASIVEVHGTPPHASVMPCARGWRGSRLAPPARQRTPRTTR